MKNGTTVYAGVDLTSKLRASLSDVTFLFTPFIVWATLCICLRASVFRNAVPIPWLCCCVCRASAFLLSLSFRIESGRVSSLRSFTRCYVLCRVLSFHCRLTSSPTPTVSYSSVTFVICVLSFRKNGFSVVLVFFRVVPGWEHDKILGATRQPTSLSFSWEQSCP